MKRRPNQRKKNSRSNSESKRRNQRHDSQPDKKTRKYGPIHTKLEEETIESEEE